MTDTYTRENPPREDIPAHRFCIINKYGESPRDQKLHERHYMVGTRQEVLLDTHHMTDTYTAKHLPRVGARQQRLHDKDVRGVEFP